MKKKLQLLTAAIMLLLTVNVNADTIINSDLNLYNPDIRKCLLDASKSEGWELKSVYMNANNKLVYVFSKDSNDKVYISK
ncbi:hypothetical protein [Mariniflexile sp. AS56]|uniref:hypothetical protein n=1 Tax=Mariniflexile sp. AS56 TaxID=3063957 RepID=UPI0026F1B3D0|nr:hypothetical protein [Mariniflexile sp. AS56]MDO7172254.1 hypothetical protein [Mariniflexile sp. AS56]